MKIIKSKKNKYKNKITCFTINAFDNGYYKDGLPVDKANRKMWLHNVEKFGNIFDFKVFDYNHPLVIECKEKYKEFFDREEIWISIKADIIRLYILSKLPYHLYIDDDTILCNNFKIEDEEDYFFSIYGAFCCIYNGNNLDVFKKILEIYPFDDKQLKQIETKDNSVYFYNIKRLDYMLFLNIYKYLESKQNNNLEINHYSEQVLVKDPSENKLIKNIIISKDKKLDYSYKEDSVFIELTKLDKPYDCYNYFHFYVNEKYYTKEEIIEMYKETGMVDKIVEENDYTKIILKK